MDDNQTNLLVLVGMLRHMGFSPHPAPDALSALEAVEEKGEETFAAILMDAYMPQLDGFEATRLIRGRERDLALPRTPIVAVTAATTEAERERAMSAGMDDFIAKPVDPPVLAHTLRTLLDGDGPTHAPVSSSDTLALLGEAARREIHEAYDAEIRRLVPLLREACASADARALVDVAHSIKGSSLSVGADEAATLAARVETLGREGELERVGRLVEALISELDTRRERLGADALTPSGD